MANRIWKFLNTDLKELCSAEAAEGIGEAGKTAAEVAKMFKEQGLENSNLLLEVLNSPLAQVVGTGLPFVGIAAKLLALFIEKTQQQPTLAECIFLVSQAAYLESFKDFLGQDESLLNRIGKTPVSDGVKQLLKNLADLEISDKEATKTVICFRDSILAEEFNLVLSERLQQAGLNADEAQILTKRVAANTHRYLIKAWAACGEAMKHLGQPSISEWREEQEKYQSIDNYLQDQIASLPLKPVFEENFSFKDIYVPLKARPIDKNGAVNKGATAFDLETWAKNLLAHENKQNRVMFVEAGPGRGKSVFCRMFADWVRQQLHPIWTPVLIRLQDIPTLQKSFRETLKEAVNTGFASDDGWLMDRNTRYLFFLDGFDELLMEGRSSGGLEQFLKQVGKFQEACNPSSEMRHRVLITGRTLALQAIERQMPENLERVEIQVMDDGLQQQWLSKWESLFGAEKTSAFQQFLQDECCPETVKSELSREPLLLYLLAAMHRDGRLKVENFQGTNSTQAKILIYNQAVNWVLTEQRSKLLNRNLTELEIEDLRRILTEAGLCVVQSGGECAPVAMIEERLKADNSVKALLEEARERIKDDPLRNALAVFYLQQGSKEGSVEFVHKSFGEFLCAERLKQSLEEWTEPGKKRIKFNTQDSQMDWEIYDLLGYGPLTEEIVEYLMGLLTTPAAPGEENLFRPVELFERLENFYLRWCEGEFIDAPPENLPQKKMRLLRDQLKTKYLGQRQIDIYAGLNVMILLLELHRYGQQRDELKNKIMFYPCGEPNAEGELDDASRLLRLIGYSCCVGNFGFVQTVGRFLSGANLSGVDLNDVDLSGVDLGDAYLCDVNLSGADLSGAYLSGADLSGAYLCDVCFMKADLSGADLSGAQLGGSGTYLLGTNFTNANLTDADLTDANLTDADLSGADLCDANLTGADLRGADLMGADLTGADLTDAILSDHTFRDAIFGDIKWNENTKWENVRGLDTAVNVPEALRRQLGMQ